MKTQFVGVRLPLEDIKVIEHRAKEESIGKTSALKKLLELGIKEYSIQKAIDLYTHGKISLEKASEIAKLSVWEMMDVFEERNIPSNLTKDDLLEGMKNIEKLRK